MKVINQGQIIIGERNSEVFQKKIETFDLKYKEPPVKRSLKIKEIISNVIYQIKRKLFILNNFKVYYS